MSEEQSKKTAAEKALDYVKDGMRVGLGTGSTAEYFIDALGEAEKDVSCVPSSNATEELAKKAGLTLTTLNDALAEARIGEIPQLDVCVDGADEVDKKHRLIKGGGGALTREKILATCSKYFIVVVDETKMVGKLGKFPLPVEVLPFSEKMVEWEIRDLGGDPVLREKYTTDNGNIILDVKDLDLSDPLNLEGMLNNIPGVVENGVFAMRTPEMVVMGEGKKYRIFD